MVCLALLCFHFLHWNLCSIWNSSWNKVQDMDATSFLERWLSSCLDIICWIIYLSPTGLRWLLYPLLDCHLYFGLFQDFLLCSIGLSYASITLLYYKGFIIWKYNLLMTNLSNHYPTLDINIFQNFCINSLLIIFVCKCLNWFWIFSLGWVPRRVCFWRPET